MHTLSGATMHTLYEKSLTFGDPAEIMADRIMLFSRSLWAGRAAHAHLPVRSRIADVDHLDSGNFASGLHHSQDYSDCQEACGNLR